MKLFLIGLLVSVVTGGCWAPQNCGEWADQRGIPRGCVYTINSNPNNLGCLYDSAYCGLEAADGGVPEDVDPILCEVSTDWPGARNWPSQIHLTAASGLDVRLTASGSGKTNVSTLAVLDYADGSSAGASNLPRTVGADWKLTAQFGTGNNFTGTMKTFPDESTFIIAHPSTPGRTMTVRVPCSRVANP